MVYHPALNTQFQFLLICSNIHFILWLYRQLYCLIFDPEQYFAETTSPNLHLPIGQIHYNKGQVNQEYPIGTVASFSCYQGMGSRTCQSDGNWNSQGETCNTGNEIMYFLSCYIYVYKHIYIYIYICIYTYIHMHIYKIFLHTYAYAYIFCIHFDFIKTQEHSQSNP